MNSLYDGISQMLSDYTEHTPDYNLNCDGNPTLPESTTRCDNCDLPEIIIEPVVVVNPAGTPPPYFPDYLLLEDNALMTNSIDNFVTDHFQSVKMEVTVIEQRLGGADVECDNISFFDGNGNNVYVIGDFTGKTQLWSGGVQHYELDDENGNHISFTKNPDGTVSEFEKSEGVVTMNYSEETFTPEARA